MYEDYYSDDNEKGEANFNIYYKNKISNILKNSKILFKDYFQAIVYLTQKQLNDLYKGEPITLNVRAKINKPKTFTFDFIAKDRSNLPSIIYLTEEQMMTTFYNNRNSTKKFKITLSKKQLKDTLKEIKRLKKQIDSFFEDIKYKNKDYNILLEHEYDKFITNLMMYSSKTPMLESRKQKVRKVIESLLKKTQMVGKYYQTFVNISLLTLNEFIRKCIQGNTKGDFILDLFSSSKFN